MTSLSELLADMSQLQAQLSHFETRFAKSQDLAAAMNRGDLKEVDALDE